jgi:hypothetical protein
VSSQEGEALAKEKGYIFQEVSAKSGANINNLFYQDIFAQIGRRFNIMGEEDNTNVNSGVEQHGDMGIKLGDNQAMNLGEKKKKKCC